MFPSSYTSTYWPLLILLTVYEPSRTGVQWDFGISLFTMIFTIRNEFQYSWRMLHVSFFFCKRQYIFYVREDKIKENNWTRERKESKDFFVCNCSIFFLLINAINISIASTPDKQIIKRFIDKGKIDSFQIKRYPYLCNLRLHRETRIIVLENMLCISVENAMIAEHTKRYISNQRQRD